MITAGKLHRLARILGAHCVLLLVAAFSSAAWAQAGFVERVSGKVTIQHESAQAVPAKAGDTFEPGSVFRTGTGAKAILKFADGQLVALGADSVLRIGRYRFVDANPRLGASSLELVTGEMRYVAGLIGAAKPEAVQINAGNSLVTIETPGGADFNISVHPDPQELGYAVVALGGISVRTPYGPTSKIVNGQYVSWRSGRTPPPLPLAAAPAVVQAATAALWAIVLPSDTPVNLAAAARMAAATAAAGPAMAAVGADPALAGYVEAVSNSVSIRKGSGATVSAKVGDTFEADTTFDSGSGGRAVLKFADGQVVVLGPASILGIDQYQFDPGNIRISTTALDLKQGAMRYITGSIHAEHHRGVSIAAGASVIDILNTGPADFTVVVDTRDNEVGLARVALGEISVHTPYGPIDRIADGKSNQWGPGTTPGSPLPAAAQAAAALQLAGLPDDAPVAVAPAARASAAQAAARQAQAAAATDPGNAQLRAAAQAAAAAADAAIQAATAASQSVAATLFATVLATLPATAAGPAQAQAPVLAAQSRGMTIPSIPAVTPGAGGGCTGSVC